MIKIKNLTKIIGEIKVLDNINLDIKNNTIVGLAGPSGSGKSTLLRCIQKLENLNSGEIKNADNSGFMFQDFQLFPHMNVLKNLTYAPMIKKQAGYEKHAMKLLKNLGLESRAKSMPHNLSGGEKQRVALARSLMLHPKLLLCDEPTSGLDVATIDDVVQLLKSVQIMGVTMIIASHDLDFLTKIADRIVILKNGQICLDVAPSEIENPIQYLKPYYIKPDNEDS